MELGLGLLGYHGSWDDAAFAEEHGFATAGFVDSPLLGGEMFACLALAARATSTLRLGTFVAVPGIRSAPAIAQGIATINRLAPGRTFLGIGTGYTARRTFGLRPVSASALANCVRECRGLLAGDEVLHYAGADERPIHFRQRGTDYIDLEHRVPVYVAADGPKALRVAGEQADGWITSLQYANVMENAPGVLESSLAAVRAAARQAGRSLGSLEVIWSTALCVLEPGERPTAPRVLERVGAHAMMPFHSYADDPSSEPHLPPAIQERLDVYRREVLARFPRDRVHLEAHRGHLSHLQEGEAAVLTDEIVRMTTLTGTAEEIAERLLALEAVGLTGVSLWIPPHLTREAVLEVERRVMPLLGRAAA